MKIIRYQSPAGETGYAQQLADGTATKLHGDLFGGSTLHGSIVMAAPFSA